MRIFEERYQAELTSLGKKLKDLRKSNKLTQLDIEVATGISRTEISKIENGLKNIEFITILKLAVAFDVPLAALFEQAP